MDHQSYLSHILQFLKLNLNILYLLCFYQKTDDKVKIYSWFAGLGLPQDRIENLKKESKAASSIAADKEKARDSQMTLDLEQNKVATMADKVHQKIRRKKSGFNRLQGGAKKSIIDKRRKKR